jgi:hypothetical protein
MNLPSIKRGAIKAMPPFPNQNAVVLQPFTGHNRIAELTVMRAVLSTTIGRGALSLMAKGTSQARPFVKAAHGPATQTRGAWGFSAIYGSMDLSSNLP